jgi:tRNA dimethylallyltransferase
VTTEDQLPRALAIVGPTAAGKSALGLEVAERFGLDVLGCDSVQVYRGLDIGSAKASREDRARVRHHGIDLCDPDETFSAGDYAREAHRVLAAHRAIIVGGTGFYLRAAAWTHSFENDLPADDPRRRAFDETWTARERDDPGVTHRALAAIDPELAEGMDPRNFVRTLRALWLCEHLGEPVSRVRKRNPPRRRLDLLTVVLDPGQSALDPAITRRCEHMLERGFLAEVEKLKQAGYDSRFGAMRSLGYKQLLDHLEGRMTLVEACEEIVRATRQYARRQRTFFRHQLDEERTERISDPAAFPWSRVESFLEGGAA